MADVLSQAEVEALLVALEPVLQTSLPNHSLGQNCDANGRRVSDAALMQLMKKLLDSFEVAFAASLTQRLRTVVEISRFGNERISYSAFRGRLSHPQCLLKLFQSQHPHTTMAFALDHSILFAIIERLLGGDLQTEHALPTGKVTEIERLLVTIVTNLATDNLQSAVQEVCHEPLHFKTWATDAGGKADISDDDVVLAFHHEIRIGDHCGSMNVCMPTVGLAWLQERLEDTQALRASELDTHAERQSAGEAGTSGRVEMIVNLAETKLTRDELASLAIGDVIVTERQTSAGVEMIVAGRGRFRAIPGVVSGQKAAQIAGPVTVAPQDPED